MPDDMDARGAPKGRSAPFEEHSPDLVGEELADDARIWRVYDCVARDEDRERVGNWNRGLDNLALFAGLFSAVTTAFIIEAQQDTEPDYARLTFLVLNASAAGVPFREEPFVVDSSVCLTNCLWISSLMLSLSASLIAIMGKDWIGMYVSRPVCNPRQWADIRTYRRACVERWYMSGVIASAPVLSLVLFAAGLVIFVAPDPFSQHVALGLALAAGGLYLVSVLSAILFPTSPFRSPATQAFRAALGSLFTSLYDRLVCPPKRRPIALLQQAMLIIGGALSYSLPTDILPFDHPQRHRFRRADVRRVWDHLFVHLSTNQARSWRDRTAGIFTHVSLARLTLSLSALLRSVLEEYHYRRQRPRARPWHSSALSYLRRTVLSDRWAEACDAPSPDLLAQSLSHLNAMTQAVDVFCSILVAIGDIAIGREVAALVSFDLKSRLATEIRHNWQKCDLVTLSRYMLADMHLWDTPLIPYRALRRFEEQREVVKSESIFFALAERCFLSDSIVMSNRHCPDVVIQPRALKYLLPRVRGLEMTIVLAQHYWDHRGPVQSIGIGSELRRRLVSSARRESKLQRRFGDRTNLIDLLVFSVDYVHPDIVTSACALILKVIAAESFDESPCLVYAFGHQSPIIANAAWTALPAYDHLRPVNCYAFLELALPLSRFEPRMYRKGMTAPLPEDNHTEMCLARTIIRLLSPSRYFHDTERRGFNASKRPTYTTTLELCVHCLQTQLRYHRTTLDSESKLEIIAFMLANSVLIRVSAAVRVNLHPWNRRRPPAEYNTIKILTIIARRLATLLASREKGGYDSDTNARLFCLFSFSEATDYKGQTVRWDLGSYLRTVPVGLLHDRDTKISMRRLVRALRALRPLCASRDDLRAAWERINLTSDDDYHDPFWDAEDFELGTVLDPDSSQTGASSQEPMLPAPIEEFSALDWLDATMR